MRLARDTVDSLPASVDRFHYDRDKQRIGIVHFGIGAFHRAHQAWYTDLAMDAGSRDWAICGISLRSRDVADRLNPQDGLFSVTERSGGEAATRVVGAVREVLFAAENESEVLARIASPDCRIVSFTVTEKGYARNESGGLDLEKAKASFYPLLCRGLKQRQERGLPGVTLLTCDNLAENGRILARLVHEWISARDPELDKWFGKTCTVPSTMIDRIVPRTTSEDLDDLELQLGVQDAAGVFTERFSQWVIEDEFAAGRPTWERCGAQLVEDVTPYETAKLRMLNGAHSMLAYCGLRKGYRFVHEAVMDEELSTLAHRLMIEEAAPSVSPAPGQDLEAYARELMKRFSDPALRHELAQIAMDGTQKIPQRWLETVEWKLANGGSAPAIAAALDGWLWHLEDGRFVDDPRAEDLRRAARKGGRKAILDYCFGTTDTKELWSASAPVQEWARDPGPYTN